MPDILVLCSFGTWLQTLDLSNKLRLTKQDIVYVEMALSTDLSIVSFPAWESLFVDQLIALCLILSTIENTHESFAVCGGS